MDFNNAIIIISVIASASLIFYGMFRLIGFAYWINLILIISMLYYISDSIGLSRSLLYFGCPILLLNTILYVFFQKQDNTTEAGSKYEVHFKLNRGRFKISEEVHL